MIVLFLPFESCCYWFDVVFSLTFNFISLFSYLLALYYLSFFILNSWWLDWCSCALFLFYLFFLISFYSSYLSLSLFVLLFHTLYADSPLTFLCPGYYYCTTYSIHWLTYYHVGASWQSKSSLEVWACLQHAWGC